MQTATTVKLYLTRYVCCTEIAEAIWQTTTTLKHDLNVTRNPKCLLSRVVIWKANAIFAQSASMVLTCALTCPYLQCLISGETYQCWGA